MNYYLLIIWNDVEPDVAGPYFTLDINNKGNPYISAYSNRFFERGEE